MTAPTRTTRRNLLAAMPAAAIAAVAMPVAAEAQKQQPGPSPELLALIDAHRRAYAGLVEVLRHAADRSARARAADRDEQEALLAVCAFPARDEGDRGTKARYLLEIEARGELDLPQHMQAVLRSMA